MKALIKRLFPGPSLRLGARLGFWRAYRFTGEYELVELANVVPRDKIAIDVGANMGVYTYHLSRLSRQVIAFEPIPVLAERLLRLNIPRTRLEAVALSDRSGVAHLRISEKGAGVASLEAAVVPEVTMTSEVDVQMRRLDDYDLRGVGFIKIDVEGHEEAVLAGARETVRRERPVLLVEIEERHNPGGLRRIAAMLEAEGYRGHFFEGGRRKALAEFDPARHQRASAALDAFTNRRSLDYVNNFLFLPG